MGNFAFIDGQNLYLGFQDQSWRLDYRRFRIYLQRKHSVSTAYLFIGYLEQNRSLYRFLEDSGYVLVFKEVVFSREGKVKGNVDAELVLQAMIDFPVYDQAVIISSDGDFACLVRHLNKNNKLKVVLSAHKKCSSLLKKAAPGKLEYMDKLERKIGQK